jgi:3-ketosteroid 9alpha-monooxygenase subunit B
MADYRLVVAEVVEETDDARSLVFEVPAEGFDYRPGQFLTLRIPSDERGSVARCYSLSSSPHTDGRPQVTVKRTPDGYASNWIHDNVVAGTVLEVLPPGGVFSPRSLDADLLCLAAGSGITPVMSIVRSVLAKGRGRIALVYANRDERSVIFGRDLTALAAANPERLTVIHWLESVQGLPSVPALRELARPFARRETFVCGPVPFMDGATAALGELDVPRSQVHVERFLSLAKNPFTRSRRAGSGQVESAGQVESVEAAAGPAATIDVTLDGVRRTVPWPAGIRLLEALEKAGLEAPFSCREGRCSACACVRLEGEVAMVHNEVLDEQDLADGYILACQSEQVSEKVVISYE